MLAPNSGPVWFRSSRVRDGRSRIIPPNGSRRSPSQTRRSRSISSPQRRLEKRPKACDLENASRVPERSPGSPPLLAAPRASKSAGRRSSSPSSGAPPPLGARSRSSADGSARPQLRRRIRPLASPLAAGAPPRLELLPLSSARSSTGGSARPQLRRRIRPLASPPIVGAPPRLELLPLSSARSRRSADGSARPQLRRPTELLSLSEPAP